MRFDAIMNSLDAGRMKPPFTKAGMR